MAAGEHGASGMSPDKAWTPSSNGGPGRGVWVPPEVAAALAELVQQQGPFGLEDPEALRSSLSRLLPHSWAGAAVVDAVRLGALPRIRALPGGEQGQVAPRQIEAVAAGLRPGDELMTVAVAALAGAIGRQVVVEPAVGLGAGAGTATLSGAGPTHTYDASLWSTQPAPSASPEVGGPRPGGRRPLAIAIAAVVAAVAVGLAAVIVVRVSDGGDTQLATPSLAPTPAPVPTTSAVVAPTPPQARRVPPGLPSGTPIPPLRPTQGPTPPSEPTATTTLAPAATPKPTQSPRSEPGFSVAERERLRAHLPASVRKSCTSRRSRDAKLNKGLVARLECVPAKGPEKVRYYRYDDKRSMRRAFKEWHDETRPSTCRSGRGTGSYTDKVSGKVVNKGALACLRRKGQLRFVWTHERLRVVAVATDPDISWSAMHRWWRSDAGPFL